MTNEISDPLEVKKRIEWQQLIRHAYDIPDLVTGEGAAKHLEFQLARVAIGDDNRPEKTGPIPRQFLTALENASVGGLLDGFFVELPRFSKDQTVLELAQ